jgi:predicted AAA+ superfamily ATPase
VDAVATFVRFLTLAAARTAQTTNYAALAHESGLSADTGLRWFGALEATFLADLVPPYWRNLGKRLVKAPKLHFGDVGLAAHMMGVHDWRSALRQQVAGPLLETLVAQHLLVFSETARRPTALFHYRTHAGAEVDFVLSRGSRLIPIEVKLSSTVQSSDVRGMASFLEDFRSAAPFGVVLYSGTEAVPVSRNIVALPITAVLEGSPDARAETPRPSGFRAPRRPSPSPRP